MPFQRSRKPEQDTQVTDLPDSTDGGWDPYVASLILGATARPGIPGDDSGDDGPVMNFSRLEHARARR